MTNITKYTTDVQNVYDHDSDNALARPPHPHMYVASPSIPSLGNEPIVAPDRSVTWTGATGGDTYTVNTGYRGCSRSWILFWRSCNI